MSRLECVEDEVVIAHVAHMLRRPTCALLVALEVRAAGSGHKRGQQPLARGR